MRKLIVFSPELLRQPSKINTLGLVGMAKGRRSTTFKNTDSGLVVLEKDAIERTIVHKSHTLATNTFIPNILKVGKVVPDLFGLDSEVCLAGPPHEEIRLACPCGVGLAFWIIWRNFEIDVAIVEELNRVSGAGQGLGSNRAVVVRWNKQLGSSFVVNSDYISIDRVVDPIIGSS